MDREEDGDLEPFISMAEAAMGFLPSIMTMSISGSWCRFFLFLWQPFVAPMQKRS